MGSDAQITVRGLTLAYGSFVVMHDLSFDVGRGSIFFIMGGSGSGKSTAMRALIGLHPPSAGTIFYDGEDFVTQDEVHRELTLRRVGVLFQSGALFSSMTVAENVGLPLGEYTDLSPADVSEVASLKLALVGLGGFEDFYPGQISGGMQKRAALARAMALDPEILFLDEPSAGLDPISSRRLDELIVELRDTQAASTVIPSLIDAGLRARLDTESFVTGQLYVNLDLFPDTPIHRVHPQKGYPEIPTISAPLEEATKSLSGAIAQLEQADLAGTARSLASAIEGINRLVNTPSISRTLKELPSTVVSVRELVQNVNGGLSRVGQELQSTVAARGPVVAELQRALVDVQRAAEAVRRLAEFLERNPNALIVGRKRP